MCARSSRTRETFDLLVSSSCGQAPIPQTPGTWITRPREAFQLGAPDRRGAVDRHRIRTASFAPRRLVGLCALRLRQRPGGLLWRPASDSPERLPGELVGSSSCAPASCASGPPEARSSRSRRSSSIPSRSANRPRRASRTSMSRSAAQRPRVDGADALLGGEQIVTDTTRHPVATRAAACGTGRFRAL